MAQETKSFEFNPPSSGVWHTSEIDTEYSEKVVCKTLLDDAAIQIACSLTKDSHGEIDYEYIAKASYKTAYHLLIERQKYL